MLLYFCLNISFTLHPSPSPSPTDHTPPSLIEGRPAVSRGTRGIWIWVALFVVLAVLLALLASLMLQPAVDAAPGGPLEHNEGYKAEFIELQRRYCFYVKSY